MRIIGVSRSLISIAALMIVVNASARESICYGTVNQGKLHEGVELPQSGSNFQAYSSLGHTVGRTFLHSRISELVVASYKRFENQDGSAKFVYGETGWKEGGRIRPHRTHQNGLSIDFMVPVKNAAGQSVPMPTSVFNKFGYNIDFDKSGKFGQYSIDFDAMALHLKLLHEEAAKRSIGIALVIFDPDLLPLLLATKEGAYLKQLPFMKKQAWVRHDEHYHIDFSIPCLPLEKF
jgi:penicillin-insensitive murein DD-endopeptidase